MIAFSYYWKDDNAKLSHETCADHPHLIVSAAGAADRRPVLLTAERVWTGEGTPHTGWAVLVSGGRIQAIGPAHKVVAPTKSSSTPTTAPVSTAPPAPLSRSMS